MKGISYSDNGQDAIPTTPPEERDHLLHRLENAMDQVAEGDKLPEGMLLITDFLERAASSAIEVDDQTKELLSSLLEESRRLYGASQRSYFRDQYAPEIASHDGNYWRFPYTEVSYALIAYELNNFARITDDEATAEETGITRNRWNQFKASHMSVATHFEKVLETIEAGTFVDDEGKEPIHVERAGNEIRINIAPIVAALAGDGFENVDIFDYPFGSSFITDTEDYDEESEAYTTPEDWYAGKAVLVRDLDATDNATRGYTIEDANYLVPYDPYDYFGFAYLTLYALVTHLNCRKSIHGIVYPPKRPHRPRNVTTREVVMPNDAITNAFFARNKHAIQPWDYFNHDTPEKALAVPTGKKGTASVIVIQDASTTIDAAIETYRMTPEDRFWLEAICSLARDGYTVIRGSDLLKFNGYKNPYQKSAQSTMNRAYHSVRKMWRMHIAIDTTKENKTKYSGLLESYDEQPLIDCNWSVLRFEDGALDFEITLNLTNNGTPLGALPLAVYASDKTQLLFAERTDLEFATIGKLTLDHRLMWRYVLRRMKDKTTSTTIVFDTIFKNIDLENIDRFKRGKMLSILHKMLEERQKDGALTFTWNRNKSGRAEYSVTITPK